MFAAALSFLIIKKVRFHENQNVFWNNSRKKLANWFFLEVLLYVCCNAAAITSVAPLVDANMFVAALSFLIIKKVGFHKNQNVFWNNNRKKVADWFFLKFCCRFVVILPRLLLWFLSWRCWPLPPLFVSLGSAPVHPYYNISPTPLLPLCLRRTMCGWCVHSASATEAGSMCSINSLTQRLHGQLWCFFGTWWFLQEITVRWKSYELYPLDADEVEGVGTAWWVLAECNFCCAKSENEMKLMCVCTC